MANPKLWTFDICFGCGKFGEGMACISNRDEDRAITFCRDCLLEALALFELQKLPFFICPCGHTMPKYPGLNGSQPADWVECSVNCPKCGGHFHFRRKDDGSSDVNKHPDSWTGIDANGYIGTWFRDEQHRRGHCVKLRGPWASGTIIHQRDDAAVANKVDVDPHCDLWMYPLTADEVFTGDYVKEVPARRKNRCGYGKVIKEGPEKP